MGFGYCSFQKPYLMKLQATPQGKFSSLPAIVCSLRSFGKAAVSLLSFVSLS